MRRVGAAGELLSVECRGALSLRCQEICSVFADFFFFFSREGRGHKYVAIPIETFEMQEPREIWSRETAVSIRLRSNCCLGMAQQSRYDALFPQVPVWKAQHDVLKKPDGRGRETPGLRCFRRAWERMVE
jgi:hypothetical protein